MIIVSKLQTSPSGIILATFNCQAAESAKVDLVVDDAYVYMLAGKTARVAVPAELDLKEGDVVPLSRFAALAVKQSSENTHLAWTLGELPVPPSLTS